MFCLKFMVKHKMQIAIFNSVSMIIYSVLAGMYCLSDVIGSIGTHEQINHDNSLAVYKMSQVISLPI